MALILLSAHPREDVSFNCRDIESRDAQRLEQARSLDFTDIFWSARHTDAVGYRVATPPRLLKGRQCNHPSVIIPLENGRCTMRCSCEGIKTSKGILVSKTSSNSDYARTMQVVYPGRGERGSSPLAVSISSSIACHY